MELLSSLAVCDRIRASSVGQSNLEPAVARFVVLILADKPRWE